MAAPFSTWSFIRRVLEQGAAIHCDNANGKFPTYEHLSAHIDDAARVRSVEIETAIVPPPPAPFAASDGAVCTRCGERWRQRNNSEGHVHHLCIVPRSS